MLSNLFLSIPSDIYKEMNAKETIEPSTRPLKEAARARTKRTLEQMEDLPEATLEPCHKKAKIVAETHIENKCIQFNKLHNLMYRSEGESASSMNHENSYFGFYNIPDPADEDYDGGDYYGGELTDKKFVDIFIGRTRLSLKELAEVINSPQFQHYLGSM